MVIDKATSISLVKVLIYMPVYSWHNEPFEHVIANEKEYYHDNGENEARELCEPRYKAIVEGGKVRGVRLVDVDVGVHCDCCGIAAR